MKISHASKFRWFSTSLFAVACIATAMPTSARAGFEKLQGQYKGTFTSSASSDFSTMTATGPTTAKLKSIAKGKQGRLNLSGSDNAIPGSVYNATIEFKAGGACTTTAVVPNVVNSAATGTWTANASGKKVKYTVSSTTSFGTYTAKGTITGTGENLKIKITFTGNVLSAGLPNKGSYIYTGSR